MAKPTTSAKKKSISKSDILNAIVDAIGEEVSRKHVKEVIETLVAVGHKELKKSGVFVLRGFAKFVVVKKPARPAREGINPFTKEKQMFAARPASKGVLNFPQQIAVDHGAVHWTDNGSAAAPFGTDDGRVMAIPK